MGKNTAPLELIILYMNGYKPKDVIAGGYPSSTAYRYWKVFKFVMEKAKRFKQA